MINYGQIYEVWTNTAMPSKTTARMTRTTLKYVATAHGTDDWCLMPALSLDHAMVLLDAAMASQDLVSQSRSNYRGYLRRLHGFMNQKGIHAAPDSETRMWPSMPLDETDIDRRAQLAYQKFVKWAIRAGVWPHSVKPDDILAWALSEKDNFNMHWRQEFRRLRSAWERLGSTRAFSSSEFPSLPPPKNSRYALPVSAWPTHLRIQWEGMCKQASDVLRKGAMRPWRDVTKKYYETRLCLFLGWFATIDSRKIEESDRWAELLSADNCRDYLNWLVSRSGNGHLNPGHPAFLRMVRGLHRFLLGSSSTTIDEFNDLAKRCDVVGRDKSARMVPYADLERGLRTALEAVTKKREGVVGKSKASLQVDVIILGLLTTRGLRSLNIREIRIGCNLVETADGFLLRYSEAEMKGHRAFETTIPAEIAQIIKDYLRTDYAKLASRPACEGDHLLLTRAGRPFGGGTFGQRVRRIAQKYIGKRLHPHIFRHIIATHAAQCLKLTPTELAAFLAHRSPLTVMKFYEVTSPSLAASRSRGCKHRRPTADSCKLLRPRWWRWRFRSRGLFRRWWPPI